MPENTENKSLLEQAIDVFVFAPVGLAVSAAEELPLLIDKGRERVKPEISNARILGRLAVSQGQRRAQQLVDKATERIAQGPYPSHPGSQAPTAETEGGARVERREPRVRPAPSADQDGGPVRVDSSALAIPGYDSLSASQVVQRLAGLSPDELDAVRRYEAATRRRKTILNRASQLRSQVSD